MVFSSVRDCDFYAKQHHRSEKLDILTPVIKLVSRPYERPSILHGIPKVRRVSFLLVYLFFFAWNETFDDQE